MTTETEKVPSLLVRIQAARLSADLYKTFLLHLMSKNYDLDAVVNGRSIDDHALFSAVVRARGWARLIDATWEEGGLLGSEK